MHLQSWQSLVLQACLCQQQRLWLDSQPKFAHNGTVTGPWQLTNTGTHLNCRDTEMMVHFLQSLTNTLHSRSTTLHSIASPQEPNTCLGLIAMRVNIRDIPAINRANQDAAIVAVIYIDRSRVIKEINAAILHHNVMWSCHDADINDLNTLLSSTSQFSMMNC